MREIAREFGISEDVVRRWPAQGQRHRSLAHTPSAARHALASPGGDCRHPGVHQFGSLAFKVDKSASAARSFLRDLHQVCPVQIQEVFTDSGKKVTNWLFGRHQGATNSNHGLDRLRTAFGIGRLLTRPRSTRINGLIERFNGGLAEVITNHHFRSTEDLETRLKRYVWLYNQHTGQRTINH